jgi:hypothetical protein
MDLIKNSFKLFDASKRAFSAAHKEFFNPGKKEIYPWHSVGGGKKTNKKNNKTHKKQSIKKKKQNKIKQSKQKKTNQI